jgi:hypothetical protein
MENELSQSIYLSKEVWAAEIKGWSITGCTVRSRSFLYLCLRQDVPDEQASKMWDHDILTKLFVLNLEKPGTTFGSRTLEGYNKPRIGVAMKPLAQGLLVARNNDGQVSVLGGGGKFPDEFIDPGKVPMTYRVKTIDGFAYSVGGGRAIYKRTDIGKWTKIGEGFPQKEASSSQGFNDMDAFSASDMYAVGGHGDVWHFDGKAWKQMGFPSNVQLGTVTCAGDGKVYISGEGGSLWVGRESTWKSIYKGSSSILWNDAAWFGGQLWLSSDYQFRVWNGSELLPVTHNGELVSASGHMDVRDGLLAIASPTHVWTFDGQQWRTIVAPYLD